MPSKSRPLLSSLFLLALALGSAYLAARAWTSVTHYQTSYVFHAELPGGEPLAKRVVLVVLDGIRLDVSKRMPNLAALAERGASGIVTTVSPSLSNPSRAVMVTGALPEINGATNNATYQPLSVDSIFSLVQAAGVPRAVAGSNFWRRSSGSFLEGNLFEREKEPDHAATADELVRWQQDTCGRMIPFLRQYPSGFLVTEVTAADEAGHAFGGESENYARVALAVDHCLSEIIQALDDGETAFVIVSDHGHIDRRGGGGHGGSEEEVMRVPLLLAGKAAAPSSGWEAQMIDVAPTISALLGLPLPATNQGKVLWQALDVPGSAAPGLHAREEQQRELVQEKLPNRDETLALARQQRRLLAALAAFLCVYGAVTVLRYRKGQWVGLLAALGVYFAVYYGLFAAFGLGYSLSAINREEYVNYFLGKDLLAGAIALLAAWITARRFATRKDPGLVVALALLVSSVLLLHVTVIYYRYGLIMQNVMLDLGAGFEAYLDLVQVVGIALMTAVIFAEAWWGEREK